ncbi:LuxR C-terminal-related transcriptional regulator [Catenulispora pinisilvae]|uniref:LuxR C-terminal-related transcriptional regulator n=1 Tax=Catenulispora pinisilvae TaxID=2705253 RepID=UPI00189160D5|nr:response regulator transcription factor [Catenulispora pinisilvae]
MRVLLCDAYRLFAEAFASALSQRGHDVVGVSFDPRALPAAAPSASSASSAPSSSRAPSSSSTADVCVVDFGPPTPDLPALADAANLRCSKLLALTSEEGAASLYALITAGVDGLISKRRGLDEIVTAIERLHSGAGYYDPVLVRQAVTERRSKEETAEARLTGTLTPRELEVLRQLVRGASTGGMAAAMGISVTTVRSHTQAVLNKLGVNSRLQAAACAVSYGLVEPLA